MKVLIVVDSLRLGSGVMGVIMNYYRHIHKEIQYDFLYIFNSSKDYKKEIISLGGNVYKLTPPTLLTFSKFRRELGLFFKQNHSNYTVVHVHEALLNYFVFKLCKKYDINTRIIHSHNSVGSENVLKSIRNKLLYSTIKYMATDFWACSDKAAKYLYGNNYNNIPSFKYVNNAIDLGKFRFSSVTRSSLRKQIGFSDDTTVIGHIGRFSLQKNHLFILEIAKKLKIKKCDFCILFIGDGELMGKVRSLVEQENLEDNFVFLGAIENVSDYLNVMDLFLLPSFFEGLPVVGVEAQANGLPLLLSDKITSSVLILPTSKMLAINKGVEEWIIEIYKIISRKNSYDRSLDVSKKFIEKKFDLIIESKKLKNFYLSKNIK